MGSLPGHMASHYSIASDARSLDAADRLKNLKYFFLFAPLPFIKKEKKKTLDQS